MTTSHRRGTAKIYQFPTRPRAIALEATRFDRNEPERTAAISDCGGAWYHEAAIQEDVRGRKP